MIPTSIGNLATTLVLRQGNTAAKADLIARSKELTSGISNDIPTHLSGNTSGLAHLEARLNTVSAYGRNSTEMAAQAEQMQIVLDRIHSDTRLMATSALEAAAIPSNLSVTGATSHAKAQLSLAISQLNTRSGGQYLFAGTRTDTAPLADGDALLAAVHDAVDPLTDTDAVITNVAAFFSAAPGDGGFSDLIYQGSTDARSAAIASGQSVSLGVNAADFTIRETLKGMVLLALASDPPHSDALSSQAALVEAAGHILLAADEDLSGLRGRVGAVETMIDHARTRNSAERATLELARNDLIGIDPYEAASAVTEAEARLEAIYSLTARLSRLSLAAYL